MRRRPYRIPLIVLEQQADELEDELHNELLDSTHTLKTFLTLLYDGDIIPCLHVGPSYNKLRSHIETQHTGFLAYLDFLFCIDSAMCSYTKGGLVTAKKESSSVMRMFEGMSIRTFVCTHRFKLYPVTHTIATDGPGKYIHLEDIRTEV